MTYQELQDLLAGVIDPATGEPVPFTFHHWEAPVPVPPYGVYFDDNTDNFAADNVTYAVLKSVNIELYLSQRDEALEGALEAVLDGAGIYWDKAASYVEDLRQYQVAYQVEV